MNRTTAPEASIAAALFALAGATGCGSEPPPAVEPLGVTASAIQGGTVDKTDSYAVGVCGATTEPGTCSYVCSGVLLAPNLVATARHCVDTVSEPSVDCTSDEFGALLAPAGQFWITTDYQMLQATKGWHEAKKIVVPPATSFCGNDLALLILDDDVTASEASPATPLVQYAITDPTLVSGSETAIGYGNTSVTSSSYGTRHERQDIPILCIPGDATAPCEPVATSGIASNEFAAGDGPCNGDSGSGAFEQNAYNQGQALALGVLSRGGTQGNECNGSVYTRFDVWSDLIVQTAMTAAALGGYDPPAWTQAPPPGAEVDEAGVAEGSDDATCPGAEDCTAAQAHPPDRGCSTSGVAPSNSSAAAAFLCLSALGIARARRASPGQRPKKAA